MNLVAELTGLRNFTLESRELPEPAPGEVQVQVAAIGICGSDMHSFAEGSVGDQICKYPMVLGHEPSGTILTLGRGVRGWSEGDPVALEPAIYCYHCEFCMSGRHNVCANIQFMSSTETPGFFRERVNLPVANLLGLGNIGLREGTLIEPLAIALHSLKFAPPQIGDRVAVIGAGPIGLLTIALLKLHGTSRIWAVEPVPHRRQMALAMGADVAIDPAAIDPAQQILHDTGRRGVDSVYDCAAKPSSLDWAIASVRSAGSLILTGIPSEVQTPVNFHTLRRKEVTLFNVRRSNHESELARDLLLTHASRFAPLITHERPIERINQAFESLSTYSEGVGKLLITTN